MTEYKSAKTIYHFTYENSLELRNDFFQDKRIKRLLEEEKGGSYLIIFIKMLLASIEFDGNLYHDELAPSFASEISLTIGESVYLVAETIELLEKYKLAKMSNDGKAIGFS